MKLSEQKILLQEAGFTSTEIDNWQKDKVKKLNEGGFTNTEIAEEFGTVSDDKPFIKYWQDVSKQYYEDLYNNNEIVSPDDEMLYYSLQEEGNSKSLKTLWSLGKRLVEEKGLPEFITNPDEPEDYTWFEGLLEHAVTLGGDLPFYGLSYLPGKVASGGNPIAGAFTAGALPAAARATIIEGLEQQTYGQPVDILKNFLRVGVQEGLKGGTQLAVTAVAPQLRFLPGGKQLGEKYLTRFLSQLTAFEGSGAILNQQLPKLKEFSYSAVLFGGLGIIQPPKTMKDRTKQIYIDTGKKPNQVFTDAIKDRTILEDISSRDYIRAYKDLKTRKTVEKEAVEQDKRFVFDDPLATAASKNIAKKDKVPMLSKENLAEIKKTAKEIKRQSIIKGIDNKYPILETMRDLGVNTKTGIEKLNLYEQARILEGMPNRAAYFIENKTINNKTLGDKGSGKKT